MPLKLFKPKPTKNTNSSSAGEQSSSGSARPKRLTINPKLWCTLFSVVLFILGAGSVAWGGLNLVEQATVPECVYLTDELSEQNLSLLEEQQFIESDDQPEEFNHKLKNEDSDSNKKEENSADNRASQKSSSFQPLAQGLGQITVQLLGAVVGPGIYQVNFSYRLGDLIKLAGGLDQDADHQYLVRHYNLAQRLKDEQRIYIPYKQERQLTSLLEEYCRVGGQIVAGSISVGSGVDKVGSAGATTGASAAGAQPIQVQPTQPKPASAASPTASGSNNGLDKDLQLNITPEDQDYILSQQNGTTSTGETGKNNDQPSTQGDCISINHATSEQLQTLTGVGPSTAQNIIGGRPYFNINDLLNVSGIGAVTLEKLEPHICL